MVSVSSLDSIELFVQSIMHNFINDYPGELNFDRVPKVCKLFRNIIIKPSDQHESEFLAAVAENTEVESELKYGVTRLHKYGNPLPVGIKLVDVLKEAQPYADHSRTINVNVHSSRLLKPVRASLKGREIQNQVDEHFGDTRVRQFQSSQKDIAILTHSIWSAQRVGQDSGRWVWRAEYLIDRCDVYKLLKFLTSDQEAPQSIQINIGDSSDLTLPVDRILSEVKICIACLQVSPKQLENIAIALPGCPNLYPENANHVIDTFCKKDCAAADRYAHDKNLRSMSVPDCLRRDTNPSDLSKINVEYQEVCEYLGDGRSRMVVKYDGHKNLFKLTNSWWLAQQTSDGRWVWRAEQAIFSTQVFKLLKFLTTTRSPLAIQINTGCHGDGEGRSAHDLKNPALSDSRILEEIMLCIACLRVSREHLNNIAIATPGSKQQNLYPENADHIIDTHCYGAKYPAIGIGLEKPLPFLYKYADHFTEPDWISRFGEVCSAPLLPENIDAILASECPFCPGKKVSDTHFLCLMPGTFGEDHFTLNMLMEFSKKSKKVPDCLVEIINSAKPITGIPVKSSYWALVKRKTVFVKNTTRDQALTSVNELGYDATLAVEAHSICYLYFAKTGKNMLNHPTYCLDEPLVVHSEFKENLYRSVEAFIKEIQEQSIGVLAIKRFIGDEQKQIDELWPSYDKARGPYHSPGSVTPTRNSSPRKGYEASNHVERLLQLHSS